METRIFLIFRVNVTHDLASLCIVLYDILDGEGKSTASVGATGGLQY